MTRIIAIKRFLALVFKVDKSYFIYLLLLTVLSAFDTVLSLFFPKLLIDILMDLGEFKNFSILFYYGITKYVLGLLIELISNRMELKDRLLDSKILNEFSKKTKTLPYSYLEDTDILDLRERGVFGVRNQNAIIALVRTLQVVLTELLTILVSIGILFRVGKLYTLGVVGILMVLVFTTSRATKEGFRLIQEIVPLNRKFAYFANTSFGAENQKDFRLYNLDELILDRLQIYNRETADFLTEIQKVMGRASSFSIIINGIIKILSYSYFGIKIVSNRLGPKIGLGDFVFYINTSEKLFSSFQKLVESVFSLIQSSDTLMPFVEYFELEEMKERDGDLSLEKFESLEFKNVSFKYPHSEEFILKDLSFKINKGEKISIVGINNAGKTTIVKLICGFFEPSQGEILLNGENIYSYKNEEYMAMIAAVFQDFKLFPFTIGENINLGNRDRETLEEVLKKIDMADKVKSLPKAENTMLNKGLYSDAVDLSLGEKQKLAISRALYKDGGLIILDEPTASLDPLAESEVYESFNNLVEDKTAIYISHRMSSSLFCDKILLIDEGRIKAFDTHKNLMKKDNVYRDLFMAQAENFR